MTAKATLIAVADAMTAEIAAAEQAAQFEGLTFEPVRSFADWERELPDFDCLRVDCIPFNIEEVELQSQNTLGYLCSVSVVVRKRFKPDQRNEHGDIANEHVDRLILFIEELNELFVRAKRLAAMPSAVWEDAEIIAAYDYDLLRTSGTFAGVLRVKFQAPKGLAA